MLRSLPLLLMLLPVLALSTSGCTGSSSSEPDACHIYTLDSCASLCDASALEIYLSGSLLYPEGAKETLRKQMAKQDGWPIVNNRGMWMIAAWEVYKVTGDREWLNEILPLMQSIVDAEIGVSYRHDLGLFQGAIPDKEAYPRWMGDTDRFMTLALRVNATMVAALRIMADALDEAGEEGAPRYRDKAFELREKINDNLWLPQKGYYSAYLYGSSFPIAAPIADNEGQALAVIFGTAAPEMASSIAYKTPQTTAGVPLLVPSPADDAGRLSTAQILWNIASARQGNLDALVKGMEDCRDDTLHSDAMLLRVMLGADPGLDGLRLMPCIVPSMTAEKKIAGLRYRAMSLDIVIRGTGSVVTRFAIDGREQTVCRVPSDLKGKHTVEITMANNRPERRQLCIVDEKSLLPTPDAKLISWDKILITDADEEHQLAVYRDGLFIDFTDSSTYKVSDISGFTVIAMEPQTKDEAGFSFRPVEFMPYGSTRYYQAEDFARKGSRLIKDRRRSKRYAEVTRYKNYRIFLDIDVKQEGEYFIELSYANATERRDAQSLCPVRYLLVNGVSSGAFVMPRRQGDEWTSTGYSNRIPIWLRQGDNVLTIGNFSNDEGVALIDYIRLIKK